MAAIHSDEFKRDAVRIAQTSARRVAAGQQSLKFSAVGGAKAKADVAASRPPVMTRQSRVGNPMSGVEHRL